MNTLVIVLIAAVCLFGAYVLYGRWLANKWGIDPAAKTPAVVHEDGRDYVPTNGWTVFAHQFSSIAGAGPVTGAIQAAAFGWLPVLLWVLLGGIFFGAVTDFGALYASVKNDGKSMGMLIEKYIGKTGRKLFLLFCWLFCGIVIAAFADMVAGTFNAFGADGAMVEAARTNGAAGMVSIMFMVFAVIFGLLQKKFSFSGWKESVISIVFIVLSFVIGANLPLILGKAAWSYITFVYIFFAAVLPMWLLKQPHRHDAGGKEVGKDHIAPSQGIGVNWKGDAHGQHEHHEYDADDELCAGARAAILQIQPEDNGNAHVEQ